jgi:hypothetical protein
MAALPRRLTDPPPKPPWAPITTAEGVIAEVTSSAPFGDPEVHVVEATLALPCPRALWQGMVGNPVTGSLLDQCNTAKLDRVKRAVLANLEARSGGVDRPLVLGASCNVLVEQRTN